MVISSIDTIYPVRRSLWVDVIEIRLYIEIFPIESLTSFQNIIATINLDNAVD